MDAGYLPPWTSFDLHSFASVRSTRADLEQEVREVSRTSRLLAVRRMHIRRRDAPRAFRDVVESRWCAAPARMLADLHGDSDAGQLGVHRATLEVLALCNKVLAHPESEPLPVVLIRFAQWGTFNTPRVQDVVAAATAFGRLRRV